MRTKKNKSGFIKILEAFIAILLITGVLLIILNRNVQKTDVSDLIYDSQYAILRQIQLNNTLRSDILSASIPPEGIEHDDLPSDVKTKIGSKTPSYLRCIGKICDISDECLPPNSGPSIPPTDVSVYSQTVIIVADLNIYSPRKLKLFCWQI